MRERGGKFAAVGLVLGLALPGACAEQGGRGGATASVEAPSAQYQTQSGQFRELQRAGLSGDYASFAKHLRAGNPDQVIGLLGQSFRGRGFDVYTWKTEENQSSHARLVELRNSTGRLYLYHRFDLVPVGWHVADWDLGRNRAAITAKL